MKKSIYILSFIVVALLVLYPLTVSAAKTTAYTDFPTLYNTAECQRAVETISIGAFATTEHVQNPYKLFQIDTFQLSAIAEDPQSGLAALDNYLWLLPLRDGSNRRVLLTNSSGTVLGGRMCDEKSSHEDIDMSAALESLRAYYPKTDLSQLTLYAVEVPMYHSSFLICAEAENAIVIPYSDASHLTHLQTGKIYPIKEAINILNDAFESMYDVSNQYNGAD